MARFLGRVEPRVAIIMGTEIWPNLLALCRARGVPVVLANLRLSDRSVAGYRRYRGLFAPALGGVAAIAAQSDEDARRIESIGAPPGVIEVTGSMNFDIPMLASLREEAAALRRIWGASRGIWIAASTQDGEEDQVLDAFERVLERLSGSLLVLVPGRPERFREVTALARRRGFDLVMRSRRPVECSSAQVFIGDTMGELPLLYAAADVAFVGGTLVERGGDNMLEPAALGLPVLFGPHVFNFAEISRRLVETGGAQTVSDSAALGRAVITYLTDADLRHTTGSERTGVRGEQPRCRRPRVRDDSGVSGSLRRARPGGGVRLRGSPGRFSPRIGQSNPCRSKRWWATWTSFVPSSCGLERPTVGISGPRCPAPPRSCSDRLQDTLPASATCLLSGWTLGPL